jgi:NADPH:quinone reductase-like Zn-dependent oxidoreductase
MKTAAAMKTAATTKPAETMKAAVHHSFGSPDVITVGDVPKPVPRGDEVLVRVHAATVGAVDSLARRGTPAYARV